MWLLIVPVSPSYIFFSVGFHRHSIYFFLFPLFIHLFLPLFPFLILSLAFFPCLPSLTLSFPTFFFLPLHSYFSLVFSNVFLFPFFPIIFFTPSHLCDFPLPLPSLIYFIFFISIPSYLARFFFINSPLCFPTSFSFTVLPLSLLCRRNPPFQTC